MPIRKGALGHIVLNVADLRKSENFYRAILGLQISARNRSIKMTFLSYGREHHDLALRQIPRGSKTVGGRGVPKLHHFCIYVGSNGIIDKLYPILRRRKIPIVSGPETLVVAGNVNKFKYDDRKK